MFSAEQWTLYNPDWLWIVIVGFIVAFVLAFGIGANDVANSFGSSVGAKVLTLKQACILGSIFEILGAVLIGAKVSDTIRKGIISVDLFPNGTEPEFMMGNLAALSGSCIWMLVASFMKLPVSATHSIVGATLGFSLVSHGVSGVNWKQLGMIVGSWFASPLLSGGISTLLFFFLFKMVLSKEKPLEPGLMLLPLFYGLTIAINFFSVFYKGSQLLHFDKIPLYGTFIITFGAAAIVAMVVRFIIVPWQRQKITNHVQFLVRQKEEEGLIESDKNYQDTLTAQSKEAQYLSQLKGKENIDPISLEPKFSSTPAKTKLPLGIHDSNVDDGVASVAQSKSNISMNSKSISMNSKSLLIKPEVHEKGASNFPVVENGVTNPVVNVSGSSVSIETDESFDISEDEKRELARNKIKETPETVSLFSFLQVLTAVFGSFAHGGNDVSNAIGPLVALWITATTGSAAQKAPVPIWILLLGGLGISLGLWILGRRVMKTLGEDLTKITPSSGFCIEVGSALTVLLASNIGIPVSTTHCKVGSIVFVGWFRSRDGVDWKLFRNIIIAWFVTLPIAGGLSAAFMAGLRELV
ncbi:sodium-dependent phosphate transporter 2-like [Mya arenaria]|uniref:sodium-dependent phosphate transporter 2-like n=1 Tax=Mya arenaria TaxID=6604 RepID=UPI0022DF1D40|nr:sodium-dependent phosphate transporter 2-like [Mya arenaria]XP_052763104.1 sodium-dependent phosphate transporter 2-like [Mya arenaria]XP_052763105.1 sodium-dependent phosphate transporter 2-like [Mya arenaria]XP_052763106.1 sodium-dependent phosphate transporter 2-like [Mya arenaria]XP_052763107.1 sodium-dependent phosphate transporter 2-like [Mya arenaria]XP_052763108.1 sodium-dependent phosphate transporter 2-like [Mya arenaria]